MSNDTSAALVVGLAQGFISLVRGIDPGWRQAWLRCQTDTGFTQVKGSHTDGAKVAIIDVMAHDAFFDQAIQQGGELMAALGKERGVFLLSVDSGLNYKIDFEDADMARWRISKMDGGTGVPEGLA